MKHGRISQSIDKIKITQDSSQATSIYLFQSVCVAADPYRIHAASYIPILTTEKKEEQGRLEKDSITWLVSDTFRLGLEC